MTTYKATHIEQHLRERDTVDDLLEAFARSFAHDCGEPVSDSFHFDKAELWAGVMTVKFEYSDQCGTDVNYVKFPIEAYDGGIARVGAVSTRRSEIAEAKQKEHERNIAAERREVDRMLARIEKRQNDHAIATGMAPRPLPPFPTFPEHLAMPDGEHRRQALKLSEAGIDPADLPTDMKVVFKDGKPVNPETNS